MKKKKQVAGYPPHLRGLSSNRYGGSQLQNERGLKGSKFGPAGKGRVYTPEEREAYERDLRKKDV